MAVRLMNLHSHLLRVDLRGGAALVLQPGQRSAALREELLYDNQHVAEWERAGWIAREPARMDDVLAAEGQAVSSESKATSESQGEKSAEPETAAKAAAAEEGEVAAESATKTAGKKK